MSATVTIRLATTDDAPAISNLILRALHEVNIGDYGPALIAEQSKNWTVDGVIARMRAVEALAIERGLDQLSLLSSITAQGFYRRLGYSPVRDVYHGAERTILMEKHLAKAEA